MPDPLEVQVPIIREMLAALGIPIVGAAEHEADDVIGTLAHAAPTLPVDIVTGDRDLFQLVDDARDVRVIYTGRGMSKLEIVTDATVVDEVRRAADPVRRLRDAARRRLRRPARRRRHRARRPPRPCWPPTATSRESWPPPISAKACRRGVRSKLLAALPYLAVAPTVVEVVKDLDLPAPDTRLQPLDDAQRADASTLAERWALGTAMTRIIDALDGVGRR